MTAARRCRIEARMIRALMLSIGQLGDRAILAVLAKSLLLTLAVLALLGGGLWFGAGSFADWMGWTGTGGTAARISALIAAMLGGWFLFRVVAIAIVGLFGDAIVEAVERRHYPEKLATARPVPFARGAAMGLASAGRALLFNLLALPVYLLLLFTGVGAPLVFIAINALLLGRDLGEMVAARHMDRAALRGWLATTRSLRFVLGLVAAGLFVVPVVNLFAPVLGIAMATHLFHRRVA